MTYAQKFLAENNLYRRLKPEVRELLDAHATMYPNSGANIKQVLGKTEFVSDLPYGTAVEINSILKRHSSANVLGHMWDCFIPVEDMKTESAAELRELWEAS